MGRFISDDEMNKIEASAPRKKKFMTDEEMANHEKGPSILSQIGDGAKFVGKALDYPFAPIRETVGSVLDAVQGKEVKNPLRTLVDGPSEARSFADLYEQAGIFPKEGSPAVPLGMEDLMTDAEIAGAPKFAPSAMAGALTDIGVSHGAGALLEKAVGPMNTAMKKGAQYTGEKLNGFAEMRSAKALGAERGTIKALGRGNPIAGEQKMKALGRQALDEKVMTPLASTEDLISRNREVMSRAMNNRKQAYDAIDDAGASQFNPLDAAIDIEENVGNFNKISPLNTSKTNQLETTLDAVLLRGDKNISMKEAQVLVEELKDASKWSGVGNQSPKELLAEQAYKNLRASINKAAEAASDQVGISGLKETIQNANKTYSMGKDSEKLLNNKFAREYGNKTFGMTDTQVAAEGMSELGGGKVAAILALKKGGERYGNQILSTGADAVSKYLLKSPKMAEFAKSNPTGFQNLIYRLGAQTNELGTSVKETFPRAAEKQDSAMNFNESHGKEALLQKTQGSKYAQALQNAAQKGDQSLAAAHYVLSQRDENYKKLIDGEGQ